MDMEAIWKMVVDSSSIIIVGTIVAAVIAGLFGMGRVQEKVEKVKEVLSKDHEGINKSFMEGNQSLLNYTREASQDIALKVNIINEKLIQEEVEQKHRYINLDKEQQEIKKHVEGINALTRNWEEVNARNKELEQRVRELELEIGKLKEKDKHKELER